MKPYFGMFLSELGKDKLIMVKGVLLILNVTWGPCG